MASRPLEVVASTGVYTGSRLFEPAGARVSISIVGEKKDSRIKSFDRGNDLGDEHNFRCQKTG